VGTGERIFSMSGKSARHTKGAFGGKRGKIHKAQRLWMANKGLKDQENAPGDSTLTLRSRIKKDEPSQSS
jgi:hypothetical protein